MKIFSGKSVFMCFCFILVSGKKLDITIEGDKIYKVGQELELKCLGNETMDATFKWIIEPDDDFKCVQEKGPKLTAKIPSICQVNITCLVEENGNSGSETIPLTIEEPCYRNENEEPDETTPTMETCSDGKKLDITIEGDKIYKVGQELELKCLGNETMDATFKWIIEPDDDFKCVQEKGPKLTAKIPSICQVNITCLVEENENSGSETIPLTIEEPCYKPDETTPTMETCSDDTSSSSMVSATTILTTFAVVLVTLWKFYCRR
ncbi:uncharacterized protein [Antedon mediterranea]|uniref:uncharacterized protein isoform X3 n=1 Tax=Antedon mediterranea TaxID=105859 RepID=UPI003AF9D477